MTVSLALFPLPVLEVAHKTKKQERESIQVGRLRGVSKDTNVPLYQGTELQESLNTSLRPVPDDLYQESIYLPIVESQKLSRVVVLSISIKERSVFEMYRKQVIRVRRECALCCLLYPKAGHHPLEYRAQTCLRCLLGPP